MSRKKQKRVKDNIHIYTNQFKILRDRSAGVVNIEYEIHKGDGEIQNEKVTLPLLACWMDRHSCNVVKAHMIANIQKPSHSKFVKMIVSNGKLDGRNGVFTAESNGIVRFGYDFADNTDECYSGYMPGTYEPYKVYDSKAIAIAAVLKDISHRLQVGGVHLINLAIVDDRVLEEVGFEKVPDLLRQSVSMWSGNPMDIVHAGGRSSWEQEKDNCESFLTLLQQSLEPQETKT